MMFLLKKSPTFKNVYRKKLVKRSTSEEAASLLASMNSKVGKTGMFSDSTPMNIEGITVYFVSGLSQEVGLYHYFYAKGDRVFWIQIDNPDESYRIGIVKESIKRI
jgi:hypothetical protein